jgi:aromatic ring-opening dioxygenase catalytic subunit (LigB family)
MSKRDLTRRDTLTAGAATVALSCTRPEKNEKPMSTARQPVAFLPHGGGPWPFVELGFGTAAENAALRTYLESISTLPRVAPKAVLVVSAHWEEAVPTLMTAAQPPLLFDYYGFPEESYRLTWPAPGAPQLAPRVQALLAAAGFQSATDATRGFDHGTFVPLKLAWPQPNVPTLQLSLKKGLDPAEHLAMGRALAPLRDEGVFIIGSGMTFHNMRGFMNPAALPVSQAFDGWLQAAMQAPQDERDRRLTNWAQAPSARQSHPREEHLLPAMVCAGAAMGDVGRVAYAGQYAGVALSAYHFG